MQSQAASSTSFSPHRALTSVSISVSRTTYQRFGKATWRSGVLVGVVGGGNEPKLCYLQLPRSTEKETNKTSRLPSSHRILRFSASFVPKASDIPIVRPPLPSSNFAILGPSIFNPTSWGAGAVQSHAPFASDHMSRL